MVLSSISSAPPAMRPVGALIQLIAQSSLWLACSSKVSPAVPIRSMASSDSFWRERTETSLFSEPSGPGSMPACIISMARAVIDSRPLRIA